MLPSLYNNKGPATPTSSLTACSDNFSIQSFEITFVSLSKKINTSPFASMIPRLYNLEQKKGELISTILTLEDLFDKSFNQLLVSIFNEL